MDFIVTAGTTTEIINGVTYKRDQRVWLRPGPKCTMFFF